MKRTWIVVAGMIGVLGFAGCASSIGTAPDGNEMKIEAAAVKLLRAQQKSGYTVITASELKAKMDANEPVVIVDTMPRSFYDKGHIPGAKVAEMPLKAVDVTDAQKKAMAGALGADKTVNAVIYCGFTACGRSDAGAVAALELGYENVYRMPGGIAAWKAAGYPTEATK